MQQKQIVCTKKKKKGSNKTHTIIYKSESQIQSEKGWCLLQVDVNEVEG